MAEFYEDICCCCKLTHFVAAHLFYFNKATNDASSLLADSGSWLRNISNLALASFLSPAFAAASMHFSRQKE
jgi:hypothetical protein